MFSKRVKLIRDIQQEISILDKKQKRELSKFEADVVREIEKRLKQIHPACRIEIQPIELGSFKTNTRQRQPFKLTIDTLNGKFISTRGTWLSIDIDEESGFEIENDTENYLSVEEMLDICLELSEKMGILVDFYRYPSWRAE